MLVIVYMVSDNKIYSDEIEIIYFTTPIEVVENYIEQSIEQKSENLRNARIRKMWFIRDGKNAGKGIVLLRRLVSQPYHYSDKSNTLS
jgi:hypothetical protein